MRTVVFLILTAGAAWADGICSDGHASGGGATYDGVVLKGSGPEAQRQMVKASLACLELDGAAQIACYDEAARQLR